LAGYLIERLVLDLVPVLDNFRMATHHVPEISKSDPWVTGIQYIEKQLEDVLTANGMQVIEVKVGDVFDPRIHEAISQEESTTNSEQPIADEDQEAGNSDASQEKIAKVLQKGYKLGERVIRPAKVVVE
jgi:molecular chaperone GrpE